MMRIRGRLIVLPAVVVLLASVPVAGQSPSASLDPILTDGGVEGRITMPEEEDAIPLTIPGPAIVTTTVEALDPLLDPVIEIHAPDGSWIATDDDAAGGTLDGRVRARVDGAGTYTAVVRSAGQGSTGRYRVKASVDPLLSLTDTTPSRATLHDGQRAVLFAGSVPSGGHFLVQVDSPFDPWVSVMDLGQDLSYGADRFIVDGTPVFRSEAFGPGPFAIVVGSNDGTVGDLEVSIAADEIVLSDGPIVIDTQGVTSLPTFVGTVSTDSFTEIYAQSSEFSPYLSVEGGPTLGDGAYDVSEFREPDGRGIVRFTVDLAGGCCTLAVGTRPVDPSRFGTVLVPGTTVEGRLASGGREHYAFFGHAGDDVVLHMRSPSLDPLLTLDDSDGNELEYDDDGGGGPRGYDAYIYTTLDRSGIYTVTAADTGSQNVERGSYTLEFDIR